MLIAILLGSSVLMVKSVAVEQHNRYGESLTFMQDPSVLKR